MSDEDLVTKILYEISHQLEDSEVGYYTIRSEYWFGRLCSSGELKRRILDIISKRGEG